MRLLTTLLGTIVAAAAAVVNPLHTPAPKLPMIRRQDSSFLAGTTEISYIPYGYYSNGTTAGYIDWATFYETPGEYYYTTSGVYWRGCSSTWTIQTSSVSGSLTSTYTVEQTDCPIFTTCVSGYIEASASLQKCETDEICMTNVLYSTYGASNGLSWIGCDYSDPDASATLNYYLESPAETILAITSTSSSTITSSASPGPTISSSVTQTSASSESSTPTSPPPPAAPGKSKTPAIAGGVVGGVVVLIAAVPLVLFLMRRKRKQTHAVPPPAAAAGYYPENAPELQPEKPSYYAPPGVAEGGPQAYDPHVPQAYNPHASQVYDPNVAQGYDRHASGVFSAGSVSPQPHSPVPQYQQQMGQRNELQG